jgi:hypothetical protein
MKLFALPHEDGSISIMQMQDWVTHPVEDEVKRSVFSSPVILEGVQEITPEQADIIRAQRPKPTIPESSAPVPSIHVAAFEVIQEENADLKAQVAQLRRDLENFPRLLAEMISRAKAEEPAQ